MKLNEIPKWNEEMVKLKDATGMRWGSDKIRRFNEKDVIFRRYNCSLKTGWNRDAGYSYEKVKGVFVKFGYESENDYFPTISNFLSYLDDAIADHLSQLNYLKKLREFVAKKEEEINDNNVVDAL